MTSPPDAWPPERFLNRELTWLAFNARVLHEAGDPRTPLLERLKFLSIVGSNLDEFFMKRIGGLKQQVGAGLRERTVDGRTPQEQIAECLELIRGMEVQERSTVSEVLHALRGEGIVVTTWDQLEEAAQKSLRDEYYAEIFPLVTPQATDPAHPFPFVSNLSLNLLVAMRENGDGQPSLARVKVPIGSGIPRFLEAGEGVFVTLESVMAGNLDLLFPGVPIDSCSLFRVTRNANTEREEESADDLLALIETEMRDRRFAPIVRVEVSSDMSSYHRGMLAAELGLDEHADVFEVDGMLATRDLMELAGIDRPELHDPVHAPVDHPNLHRGDERPVFHVIRDAGSLLLHHPYQSFATSVERFLREASRDPKVRAIKMTLYRTDAQSKVVDYLIDAADNGKQVAVVVELKARFEEERNIQWANQLEEAGVGVTYGVVGLKTHCKVILVVRRDYDGLRRYAHVGTGNYNADTARLYTDLGLLTADPLIGQDLTELFNYLTTGIKPKRKYTKILPSPKHLKPALIQKIEREIELHSEEQPGRIQIKTNALEDVDVTRALYLAAQAGVRVELLVRDSCRLRPGILGVSESAKVVSIVGRFLEHSRIYYFQNGGDEEYYIGSADCMKRNLESRVEVLVPVDAPELQRDLRMILDVQFGDTRAAWEMGPDGEYTQRVPESEEERSAQDQFIDWALERDREASRLKRRRGRGSIGNR